MSLSIILNGTSFPSGLRIIVLLVGLEISLSLLIPDVPGVGSGVLASWGVGVRDLVGVKVRLESAREYLPLNVDLVGEIFKPCFLRVSRHGESNEMHSQKSGIW